jgi:heterodisulfide reductase subunit A
MNKKMVIFTLNGEKVQAEEGMTILQVAESHNIYIPTLCYHKALEPAGLCRLCTVELFDGRRTRFVTACNYPIWEGMEVKTNSEEIIQHRKMIVELLLSRCPNNDFVKKLAAEFGVEAPRFKLENDDCILCGLCVRVCERMGAQAINFSSRGGQLKVSTPFEIYSDECMVCGACASLCPTGHIKLPAITTKEVRAIPSEYNEGLSGRKPIFVPYAQAIPNTPVIDRSMCAYFINGGCKICSEFCPPRAIDYTQVDEEVEIEVGTIIVAPGCEVFNPEVYDVYGYQKSPNIVTSLEFERMLSASGPLGGHLTRPSDQKEPKKIAWIQCVGSRDVHEGAKAYCSAVCCTYAIKEAIVAKEHSKESLDAAIFYIDMRTYGKDFERYYNRAEEEAGVRFIKSRITNILPVRETGELLIRYTDEVGRRVEEAFDLVVLSVGFGVSKEAVDLAKRLDIELDPYHFASTSSFEPVRTSKPGIFVCGAFQGPKDIPTSVIESSASAAMAESILADARWSMTKTKTIPEEIDVRGELPRVGVFVCKCGTNIAGVLDVPGIAQYARSLPGVVYVGENLFSCSQDTQEKMTQIIKEQKLNRVVVAACSPLTHEVLFQETVANAGINKYLFEMANIRNQCSWVHSGDKEAGTEKAKDLVRMAVVKVALFEPMSEPIIRITQTALVIGGGLSGMSAAKNLSAQGYQTYLIEKGNALGGQAQHLYQTWRGENVQKNLTKLIQEVQSNPKIDVYLSTELKQVEGFVGNFKSTIQTNGREKTLEHGIAIIATGASELKPDQYLYGQDPRVLTGLELDRKLIDQDASLRNGRTAVFIQCVGSRIKERPYCSKVCCTHSVLNGLKLKEINPEMDVFIIYRDMRTYGLREDLYREARSKGVVFIRYDDRKELRVMKDQEDLQVLFTSYVLSREIEIRPDLLILATAIVPPKENPIAKVFKVPVNNDGFFVEAHVKLRPIDFATDGVFVCGLAHAPKPIDESIAQGLGASARAVTLLSQKEMFGNAIVAQINPESCVGCQGCLNVCPYEAIRYLEDRKICEINEVICKGCGACAATCPSASAQLKRFTSNQIYAQIEKAMAA